MYDMFRIVLDGYTAVCLSKYLAEQCRINARAQKGTDIALHTDPHPPQQAALALRCLPEGALALARIMILFSRPGQSYLIMRICVNVRCGPVPNSFAHLANGALYSGYFRNIESGSFKQKAKTSKKHSSAGRQVFAFNFNSELSDSISLPVFLFQLRSLYFYSGIHS